MKQLIKNLRSELRIHLEAVKRITAAINQLDKIPAVPKQPVTYTDAAPGRKQCPKCKVFLPIRKNTCVCGHCLNTNTKAVDSRISDLYKDMH
jgi:ribosomal protein S27AE